MFLGAKSKALRLDEKQHGGTKVERLATKIRNPGILKLQTPNRKLQFAKPNAKPNTRERIIRPD